MGPSIPVGFGPPQPPPSSQPSFTAEIDDTNPYSTPSLRPSQQPNSSTSLRNQPYRHATAGHKILLWPAIQNLILQAVPSNIGDLKDLDQNGSAFIMRMRRGTPNLPLDELQDKAHVGMQSQATRATGGARTIFPYLSREVMHRLATSYFDTFNFMYPFMDRQNFISDTLARVYTEGFDGDTDSVLALLVFALGELAIEGSRGNPVESYNGRQSGIRGGTLSRPPGLALFNEARKRMGYVLTDCELEHVQMYSLAACVIHPLLGC